MNTEMRWLPVLREDKDVVGYGPAVRDLQDAQDWCQLQEDEDAPQLDWQEDVNALVPSSGSPRPFGAFGENEVDYEITPIEVQV